MDWGMFLLNIDQKKQVSTVLQLNYLSQDNYFGKSLVRDNLMSSPAMVPSFSFEILNNSSIASLSMFKNYPFILEWTKQM